MAFHSVRFGVVEVTRLGHSLQQRNKLCHLLTKFAFLNSRVLVSTGRLEFLRPFRKQLLLVFFQNIRSRRLAFGHDSIPREVLASSSELRIVVEAHAVAPADRCGKMPVSTRSLRTYQLELEVFQTIRRISCDTWQDS